MKKTTITGTTAAFFIAVCSGIESIIIPFIFIVPVIFNLQKNNAFLNIAIASTIGALFEGIGFILSIIIYGKKTILLSLKLLKNFQSFKILLSVIVGPIFGNIISRVAILIGGSSYGMALSAIYSLFTILGSIIFLKDRYYFKVYIWLVLTIIASTTFIVLPSIISNNNSTFIFKKQGVALLLSLFTAMCWASEVLILRSVLNKIKSFGNKMENNCVQIRFLFSFLIELLVIVPITGSIFSINNNPYEIFVIVTNHYEIWIIVFLISIIEICIRWTQLVAVKNVGAARTSIIDANFIIIVPIFAYATEAILRNIKGSDPDSSIYKIWEGFKDDLIPWWAFLIIIAILICLSFTIFYAYSEKYKQNRKISIT